MRTSQGKNGMVREAGRLMKLTKNKSTSKSTLRGEGSENAKDKEDDHQRAKLNKNKHIAQIIAKI